MTKLNQVIAIEKEIKSRVNGEVTTLHQSSKKSGLFDGFAKIFERKDDAGEQFPPERQLVQMVAADALRRVSIGLSELFQIEATKDFGNCNAKADVMINGEPLLGDVPATFLLFLEKQMNDIRTFVESLPVLDPAEEWNFDQNSGLFKAAPTKTHKTKKIQRPIVLYDATQEHPAQTQLITEDEIVGYWNTVKHSGALPANRKNEILQRINTLAKAVKFAREQANSIEVVEQRDIGERIFGFLLK